MSKLDYVTIIIVAICVAALIYLVVNTVKLMNKDQPGIDSTQLETTTTGPEEEDGTYVPDDSGAYPDAAQAPGAADDYDPDDDEVDFIDPGAEPTDEGTSTAETDAPSREVQPVPAPPVERRPPPAAADAEGEFLVLAGSYRVRDNADTEVKKLKRLGYDHAQVTIFNRGTYATVLVERFDSVDDATALVKELKSKHGIDSYVKRRQAGE